MKKLLIPLCLLCFIDLSAQKKSQELVDSMLRVLPTLKEDSNKVNLILDMTEQMYYLSKMNEGISYLKKGIQLSEKINWKKGVANSYCNLGNFVGDTGNIVQARVYFEKSLAIYREIGAKSNIIISLNNLGRGYQFESDFQNAVKCFFDALKMAEEMKSNEKIALVGTNITATYIMQKNYAKAEEYGKMTLQHAELGKAPYHAASSLEQLGVIYAEKNDTAGAISYFNKSMAVYRSLGALEGELECMSEISNLEKPEAALKRKLEIQKLLENQNSLIPVKITNMAGIGMAYFELSKSKSGKARNEDLAQATNYLKRSIQLAKESSYIDQVAASSMHLSEVEKAKRNFEEALSLNITYHAINDSIFSQENKNKIASVESQKAVDLKDKEIQINKLVIANQQKTQWSLIAGLTLLLIIGALLYWQGRNRKKTNTTLMVLNNQLDEANKIKARFFSILSHDLRSPIVNLVHFLQLQKDNPDLLNAHQQTVHRQNISDSAEDLLNNMEAMLLWSKEQMENFRPNMKDVAIGDLFQYIQKFFAQTEHVQINFQDTGSLVVATDENYLRTIMQNLTSNAIRALKNTPGATIEWKAVKEGNTTVLSITDNGPGIGKEQVKNLFDETIVNNEKTGFGFHLIRDLAKAIQYKIAVQSEPGCGTTFILSNVAA